MKYVFTPDMIEIAYTPRREKIVRRMCVAALIWISKKPYRHGWFFRYGEAGFGIEDKACSDARALNRVMALCSSGDWDEMDIRAAKRAAYRVVVDSWPDYVAWSKAAYIEKYPLESLAATIRSGV